MDSDKLSKWSSIAEITSSIAVLITLIYLAIQTNQVSKQTELNTDALLSSARQESLNAQLDLINSLREMSDNSLVLGSMGISAEEKELFEYRVYHLAMFRTYENMWFQYLENILDERTYLSLRNGLVNGLNRQEQIRNSCQYWSEERIDLDIEFVKEINSLTNY